METGHHESTEQISPQSETWLRNPERPPTPKGSAQSPVPPPPPAACGSRSLLRGLIFWRSWSFRLRASALASRPSATDAGRLRWGGAACLLQEIKSPFGIDSSPWAGAGVVGFSFLPI